MHRNTVRMILAGVVVFYVVVGGLWATSYFPLKRFYEQTEITKNIMLNSKGTEWADAPEYNKANDYVTRYALTHGDIFVTEDRISLYQSLLLWGTVALAVGASVLFLTRRRRAG